MPGDASGAALSVVVVGRDGFATLRPILECLAEQTIARRIEVIAVVPVDDPSADPPPPSASAFRQFKTIAAGAISNRGTAAAQGTRHASGTIVAFTENHCFPSPDWAEKLIASYTDDLAGVGPAIVNANPESTLSWVSYAGGYCAFASHKPVSFIEEMPIHNTSYRRQLLANLSNELEYLLADERRLMRRLKESGGRFLFRPDATASHLNEATWRLVLGMSYFNGRRFGGRRAEGWPWSRRLMYAAAFPLLSGPLLRKAMRDISPVPGRPAFMPKLLPALWLQALAHSLGEAVGYLRGPKDVFDFVDDEEFMILERLGAKPPRNERITRFIGLASPMSASASQ